MEKQNKNVYTKSRLIKELAFRSGIKQSASKRLLEALAEIAYREARLGPFVIPGICKLELCDRKSRKLRNPRTGEQLIMPPHKALRITASRRAKAAIAPRVAAVPASTYVEDVVIKPIEVKPPMGEVPPPAAVPEVVAETASAESAASESGEPISFRCPGCQQEIEAPRECVGQEAECPMCGRIVNVPAVSEPGTMYGGAVPGEAAKPTPEVVTAKEAEDMDPAQLKNRTIRIDASLLGFDDDPPASQAATGEQMISFFCKKCHQEIEATADMAGSTAECPNCGEPFVVPMFSDAGTVYDDSKEKADAQKAIEVQKHSTMRIDLPDDF